MLPGHSEGQQGSKGSVAAGNLVPAKALAPVGTAPEHSTAARWPPVVYPQLALTAGLVDLCGPQLGGVSRCHLSFGSWSQLLNQLVHLDFTVGWELACWHTPESGHARLLCG